MKVFAILLLCFVPLFAERALVGSKKCTYGPAYWCNSLQNSHECKAVDHCIHSVWKKQQHVPVQGGPLCLVCTDLVNEAKQMLDSKKTEQEIQQALDKDCGKLGQYSLQCQQLINTLLPELLKVLDSGINANQLCDLLKLCNATNVVKQKKAVPVPQMIISKVKPKLRASGIKRNLAATPQCILCEFVLNGIDSSLKKNATEHEIIEAINKVCDILPSTIKAECSDFVDQYGPAVLQLLAQEVNPKQVCTLLKLCTASKGAIECGVCKDLIQFVNTMAQKPSTNELAKAALTKGCKMSKLSIMDKLMCYGFVADYEQLVLPMVLQQLAPAKVCSEVQMCR